MISPQSAFILTLLLSLTSLAGGQDTKEIVGFPLTHWIPVSASDQNQLTDSKMILREGGYLNPTLFPTESLQFLFDWSSGNPATVTVGLFAQEHVETRAPITVSLIAYGGRLWVVAYRTNGHTQLSADDMVVSGTAATVRIEVHDNRIQVFGIEKEIIAFTYIKEECPGQGLRFDLGVPWTSPVQESKPVIISDFRTRTGADNAQRK